jgi:hypothetical protein
LLEILEQYKTGPQLSPGTRSRVNPVAADASRETPPAPDAAAAH